jgi:hypothetical protein
MQCRTHRTIPPEPPQLPRAQWWPHDLALSAGAICLATTLLRSPRIVKRLAARRYDLVGLLKARLGRQSHSDTILYILLMFLSAKYTVWRQNDF